MNPTVFDIETAPLPDDVLQKVKPEFEPAANLKDPEKIKEDIRKKEQKWIQNAALDATTGKVLCIGYLKCSVLNNRVFRVLEGDEAEILQTFWGIYTTGDYERVPFVGFNTRGFDLPFIVRRSWANNVMVPKQAYEGRYFSSRFIDLMEVWQCFSRSQERISLDSLCKFLGIGGKNGSGADFHKLWEMDKPKALEYVQNDLSITLRAAELMGAQHWYKERQEQEAA